MTIINLLDDFDKAIENTEGVTLPCQTPLIMKLLKILKSLKCFNLICWFVLVLKDASQYHVLAHLFSRLLRVK